MTRIAATLALAACLLTGRGVDRPADEREFLADVHETTELSQRYTDGQLVDIGHRVCDAFAAGATAHEVLDAFAPYPDDTDLAQLAGYAAVTLCPGRA